MCKWSQKDEGTNPGLYGTIMARRGEIERVHNVVEIDNSRRIVCKKVPWKEHQEQEGNNGSKHAENKEERW